MFKKFQNKGCTHEKIHHQVQTKKEEWILNIYTTSKYRVHVGERERERVDVQFQQKRKPCLKFWAIVGKKINIINKSTERCKLPERGFMSSFVMQLQHLRLRDSNFDKPEKRYMLHQWWAELRDYSMQCSCCFIFIIQWEDWSYCKSHSLLNICWFAFSNYTPTTKYSFC